MIASGNNLSDLIERTILAERLPPDFDQTIESFYMPLADHLAKVHSAPGNAHDQPMVVGINGGQGSGKSTLALFLKLLLEEGYGLSTVVISLDDLYLTRAERIALAEARHPLLAMRGVPGTHDAALGMRLLDRLANDDGGGVRMPRFDKASDERVPQADWQAVTGPVDIILLEGWCVGARPQLAAALAAPVNQLEQDEDPDGIWRRYVNAQLAGPYAKLFARLDHLIMLKVPNFECVAAFRSLQESKLREKVVEGQGDGAGLMDDAAIKQFIMHYERLTRHMLAEMPGRADVMLELDENQQITAMTFR